MIWWPKPISCQHKLVRRVCAFRPNLSVPSLKYGLTRNGKSRYPAAFYTQNHLMYQTIVVTDILNAEQLERKLIIGYPMLPEAIARMERYGIFLKRPPGNTKDM